MSNFAAWLTERESHDRPSPILAAPYSVVPTIAAAGPQGISRGELGKIVGLDAPHLLDSLLQAYVGIGWITATEEGGRIIYRVPH